MSQKRKKSGPSSPRTVTHNGETLTIAEWSRRTGISISTIRSRLDKLKMSPAEALTRPADKRFDPSPVAAPTVKPAPPLRKDERGRGVARWTDGTGARLKKVFGRWGEAATAQAYNRWAAEWHSSQGAPHAPGKAVSVASLIMQCLEWASRHYVKNGKQTSEVAAFRAALGPVNELYGDQPADEFTATRLRTIQSGWEKQGKSLETCNAYLRRVVRCWSWGVSRDLVPASVAAVLAHVPTLVAGRSSAALPEPITAVPDADFLATLPHLAPDPARRAVFEAMLRVQRHSGARPQDVREMRPKDIDRTREPWKYTPASGGKMLHLDKPRRIFLGPLARAILGPLLVGAAADQLVFRVARKGGRLGPVRAEELRAAIAQACALAGVTVWTPHQLRHAKATEVQREYEDDQAVADALGATPEVARQVYVDDPADAAAKRIAEELG